MYAVIVNKTDCQTLILDDIIEQIVLLKLIYKGAK